MIKIKTIKATAILIICIYIIGIFSACDIFMGQTTLEPSKNPEEINSPDVSPSQSPTPTPTIPDTPTPTPTPTPPPQMENPSKNTKKLEEMKSYINRYFSNYEGRYGLTFIDVKTGNSFGIDDYDQYIAASTSKLPITLYLFTRLEANEFTMDHVMEYTEADLEYGTGKIIKGNYGDKYTVAQLIELSLVHSDNCAINMIIRLCGRNNILDYMKELGAVVDYGPRHRSCPADMAVFANELYDRYIDNPELYGIMVHYLENTIFNDRINKLMPRDVRVAHKIGSYFEENAYNDVGIVFAENPYIVSFMSEHTNPNLEAYNVIAEVSLMIYKFTQGENYQTKMNPIAETRPEAFNFRYDVINPTGTDFYKDLIFSEPEDYSIAEGVLTFRSNNHRDGGAFGSVNIVEEKLDVEWSFDVGVIDNWPGTGWTGQPSIINWPVKTTDIMNVYPKFKGQNLKEVIYAAMDGYIYFCELETGEWTRPPINIGFPTKGSVTVDPRGWPIFYTGQGVDYNGDVYGMPKYRMFSLIDQSLIYEIPGRDPHAYRGWYAFDSSGLLHSPTDTFIECGENGLVYIMKMNTQYDKEVGSISVNPETVKYRYVNPINGRLGIENSPAIYKNYMFFADNGGLLQCVDLTQLKPMWMVNLEDDVDSTIVIEETSDGVFLYASNELDLRGKTAVEQGVNPWEVLMDSHVRKFNAMTGELIWEKAYPCYYDSYINGGFLATPALGKNDISDRIITMVAKTGSPYGGRLVALDKKTGEEIWAYNVPNYGWSSPVSIFDEIKQKTYILYCNFSGMIRLIDPVDGKLISETSLGANIESTPAVFDDMAVVGSYEKKIFGIRIK